MNEWKNVIEKTNTKSIKNHGREHEKPTNIEWKIGKKMNKFVEDVRNESRACKYVIDKKYDT